MLNHDERRRRVVLIRIIRANLKYARSPRAFDFAIESSKRDFAEYLRSGQVTLAGLKAWAEATAQL